MSYEDVRDVCRKAFANIDYDSLGFAENADSLSNASKDIGGILKIKNLRFKVEAKDNKKYFYYYFNTSIINNSYSGFVFDTNSFEDKLTHHMLNLSDGIQAIKIINDSIDKYCKGNNTVHLEYLYGRGDESVVNFWNYKSIIVELGKKSKDNILLEYRKGEDYFKSFVKNIVANNSELNNDITYIIYHFNELDINKKLGISLSSNDLTSELTRCMLSRNDVINYLTECEHNRTLELYSVEIVQQLGTFIALVLWKVDFKKSNISIELVNECVIDADGKEIVTNYSICNRVEKYLELKDDERKKIFNC
ncbi:MAG: hypothetical protein IJ593_12455 [Lachnospiraceae bacterium]|nr:hypothetical protein [Lachnospiraceae bacterium]